MHDSVTLVVTLVIGLNSGWDGRDRDNADRRTAIKL